MIEATSCGGVVIFRGKILLLYKNYRNKYEGWVLPKGTMEEGEDYKETALREVREETAAADTATKAADTAKTDSSSSNGLPTPAIIGIVAAVVVVVVVIVVVATSKKKKAN